MFAQGDRTLLGIVKNDGLIDVARHLQGMPADLGTLIPEWPTLRPKLESIAQKTADFPLNAVTLLAPIARPRKIFAIGLNYADHCAESGMKIPTDQVWFSKAVTAVNGPFDPIELPAVSEQLDYECEMVTVIGTRGRNVPKERAHEVVFGFCVGNDVSVRDWQQRTSQWVLGKILRHPCTGGSVDHNGGRSRQSARIGDSLPGQRRGAPKLQHPPSGVQCVRSDRVFVQGGDTGAR